MKNISEHLTYREVTYSNDAKKYGIENIPNEQQLENIIFWAINIFEPVRRHFRTAIHCNSVFRSEQLNKKIKGAKNSQHLANNGAAGDLDADYYGRLTNIEIFNYIKDYLEFDQLIWEFGTDEEPAFVHCSWNEGKNRNMILKAYKNSKEETKYEKKI